MKKKTAIVCIVVIVAIYVLFQFDIRTTRFGTITDQEGMPVGNVDIIYTVADKYPNFGGASTGEVLCYWIKTEGNGSFKLPATVRWSPYPFFFTEPYMDILKNKDYKLEFVLPENDFSQYQFDGNKLNNPIVLTYASKFEEQIGNLETITKVRYGIGQGGLHKFCDKEGLREYLFEEIRSGYNELLTGNISVSNSAAVYYNLGALDFYEFQDIERARASWNVYLQFEPQGDIVGALTHYEIFPSMLYSEFHGRITSCLDNGKDFCVPIKFIGREYPE